MAYDHSKKLRGQGNQLFREACDEHLAPVVRSGRFIRAGSLYTQALAASRTEDERAKCRKNLGAVHWNQAKMSLDLYCNGQASSLLHERHPSYDVEMSVENYLAALKHGRASHQRKEWIESIDNTLEEMALCLTKEHVWIMQTDFLNTLASCFQSGLQSGGRSRAFDTLQLAHVQVLFEDAMKELHRKDSTIASGANLTKCLALLDRCNSIIDQVQRRAKEDYDALQKVREVRSSVDNCRRTCESIRAREIGKRFMEDLRQAKDDDTRSYYLTCALDKFKEAAGHAKGLDAECEAEALACAGDAYTELKKEDKASSYYSAVVNIAKTSDVLQKKGFYQKARAAASAWLKKVREGKPAAHLLPELKGDLEAIDIEFKRLNTGEFLKYLYKSYPPRLKEEVQPLGELGSTNEIRAALRKALLNYHPDHNAVGDYKWGALCGEITKLLLIKLRSP